MSFILEALRKSENERQRQSGPDFASIPEAAEKRAASRWPMLVAILILFNIALLAVVFWPEPDDTGRTANGPAASPREAAVPQAESGSRPAAESRAPDQPAGRSVPATSSPGAGSAERPSSEPPVVPRTSGEPSEPAPGIASATTGTRATAVEGATPPSTRQVRPLSEEATAPATQDDGPPQSPGRDRRATGAGGVADASTGTGAGTVSATGTVSPAAEPARPPAASPSPTPRDEGLPTANELRLQGFLTGPPLHLDLHVYYPEASRRVVFISGNRYREGDRVKDGPIVREIVPEGVVLEERGRRFILGPD